MGHLQPNETRSGRGTFVAMDEWPKGLFLYCTTQTLQAESQLFIAIGSNNCSLKKLVSLTFHTFYPPFFVYTVNDLLSPILVED